MTDHMLRIIVHGADRDERRRILGLINAAIRADNRYHSTGGASPVAGGKSWEQYCAINPKLDVNDMSVQACMERYEARRTEDRLSGLSPSMRGGYDAFPADQLAAADNTFQTRVHDWIIACFGAEIGADRVERNHRFIEEALELVHANGCTASEAHQLVDYVFSRPVGEPHQEVGGVMNTLAALCTASGLDMEKAGEDELARIWTKADQIRAKQAAKPKHPPLPVATPDQPAASAALTVPEVRALVDALTDCLMFLDNECAYMSSVHPERSKARAALRGIGGVE